MSCYNELNELYMEKVAARSYGRNPDGSRRTAAQLIKQLGGAIEIKNPTRHEAYWDMKINGYRKVPQYYITKNGKYNFSYNEGNNPHRINLGRHLGNSKKYSEKTRRQNEIHLNRLPDSRYSGDTAGQTKLLRKLNEKKDEKDMYSGRHPVARIFGDKAKENVKNNKTILTEVKKSAKSQYMASKAPYAVLAAGLLTAGMAETQNLYNKIKDKREREKQENKNKELVSVKG